MVVHNGLEMTRLATLRTLRHSAAHDARLVVVDNGSNDGTEQWLDLLARRGDIDLIRTGENAGHGPGLETARRRTTSPFIVALDSDAFPLRDDWLPVLRSRLNDHVRVAGIRHHRDYVHPSCLMIERRTLDEMGLTFLNEKRKRSRLDVGERISCELKSRGFGIAGLERTGAKRRGSISEPVYLGSTYEDLVYHQWYTTRAATAGERAVDDVPREAIERSLEELFKQARNEPREVTVVMGVRAAPEDEERVRNAAAALEALNFQDLERWRYRLVVVEQAAASRLERRLAPLVDDYVFAYNAGAYNRSWAFNVGAVRPSAGEGALCFIDADLLVPPDFLRRCLERFSGGTRAVLPYSEVMQMDADSTKRALRDRFADPMGAIDSDAYRGRVFTSSQGGCIWVDAAVYRTVGGHDERFRGWGREDREFFERLSRTTDIERLPGRLLHLDHARPDENDADAQENHRLYDRISSRGPIRCENPVGDPNRYAAERTSQQEPSLGMREWENWHRWSETRIDGIVRKEFDRLGERTARSEIANLLVQLGATLLDVGCGPGALWPHLAAHRDRISWAGVDSTRIMTDVARRRFPDVPVHHADAAHLPMEDGSFDVVLLRHVLEHLPPDLMGRALSEAMRVAQRAVVLDFHLPPVFGGARRTSRLAENFLETRWTAWDVEMHVSRAGCTVHERLCVRGAPNETAVVWILAPSASTSSLPEFSHASIVPEILKISIVMPTYYRKHTIFRTVDMIRAQTYRNWELIIIDNAGDADYRFDDARIRMYRHAERPSAAYARSQGLQYVTGDLVCYFDDDDDMYPDYLEQFARMFHRNPDIKLARCGMIVSDGTVDFSFATPECCVRRAYAQPLWPSDTPEQDQHYFRRMIERHAWSEKSGDIALVPEALCRARTDRRGGLRRGRL